MDQKALRLVADTYRTNPNFDTATAILEVGVGEAVTSFLLKKGVPGVVERTLIRPPSSQLGPITSQERASVMAASPVAGKYETPIDRLSAHEILRDRANRAATAAEQPDHVPNADPREFNAARRYYGHREPCHQPHHDVAKNPKHWARRWGRRWSRNCLAQQDSGSSAASWEAFSRRVRNSMRYSPDDETCRLWNIIAR